MEGPTGYYVSHVQYRKTKIGLLALHYLKEFLNLSN